MQNKKWVVQYAPGNSLGHPALAIFEYTQDAGKTKVFDCSLGKEVWRQDWHTNNENKINYCCPDDEMIHRVENGFIFAPFDTPREAGIYEEAIRNILAVMARQFDSIVKGEKEE